MRNGSHLVEHELGGRASGGETSAPRLLEIESARQPIGVEQLAGEKNARRDAALTAVANRHRLSERDAARDDKLCMRVARACVSSFGETRESASAGARVAHPLGAAAAHLLGVRRAPHERDGQCRDRARERARARV